MKTIAVSRPIKQVRSFEMRRAGTSTDCQGVAVCTESEVVLVVVCESEGVVEVIKAQAQ